MTTDQKHTADASREALEKSGWKFHRNEDGAEYWYHLASGKIALTPEVALQPQAIQPDWMKGTGYELLPDMIADGGDAQLHATYTPINGIKLRILDEHVNDACEFHPSNEQAITLANALLRWVRNNNGFERANEVEAVKQIRRLLPLCRPAHVTHQIERLLAVLPPRDDSGLVEFSDAARALMQERKRQVQSEGWTPEHDDEHDRGEMSLAAACYASPQPVYLFNQNYEDGVTGQMLFEGAWPWDGGWWKPQDRRRNLVKAGALILAEIERLDRLTQLKADPI